MQATLAMTSCPKCGSTTTRIETQRFRDGTTHRRESCAGCGKFIRYAPRAEAVRQPLPVTPSRIAAPSTPPPSTTTPAASSTVERTVEILEHVRDLVLALLTELKSGRIDQPRAVAVLGCAVAAMANLERANVASLAEAVRRGQLPRMTNELNP